MNICVFKYFVLLSHTTNIMRYDNNIITTTRPFNVRFRTFYDTQVAGKGKSNLSLNSFVEDLLLDAVYLSLMKKLPVRLKAYKLTEANIRDVWNVI